MSIPISLKLAGYKIRYVTLLINWLGATVFGVGEVGVDYTSRCSCNFQCDKHESCNKVQAQHDFVRGVVPLAAEHNLPLIVHCKGLTNTDGRATEDVLLLIEETGQKYIPIHGHAFIGNSAEVHK